jgi:DNA polymerase (family 10)
VTLVVSTDAHAVTALANLRWGVHVARKAWAEPKDLLNAQPLEAMRRRLRRHRA